MVPQCHLEVGLISVPGHCPNYLCNGSSTPAPQQRGSSCLRSFPLSCRHQFCLQYALHTLALWALLEEAIPPGGRSWQKVAISLSRLQEGNFPLRGEDEGRFLCASLQRKCGPGQTAGGFCCSECAAPTLHGFPARTSGSQVRRYACEAISPLGYGCLKDSGHHRQIWDRHLAGYLVPAGPGL